jgi:outer membrane autotransporter protein
MSTTSAVSAATPNARLTYLHAWAGSFADDSGVIIDLENAESLRGELALRLGKELWKGGIDGSATLEAGVRHEFLGETEATVSGLSFTDQLPGTLGLLAASIDLTLAESLKLGLRGAYAKGDQAEELSANLTLDINLN